MKDKTGYSPPPEEFSALPPEEAPLPEEFGASLRSAPAAEKKTGGLRRLLTYVLCLVMASAAAINAGAKPTAAAEPVSTPEPVIETVEPEPPEVEEVVSTPAPDPYEGISDAELLVRFSPWAADGISAVFMPGGSGYWIAGDLTGIMEWSENSDGTVAYSGYAVLLNYGFSSSSGGVEETQYYLDEIGEVYDMTPKTCSGTVLLNRIALVAGLGNPLDVEDMSYNAGGGSPEERGIVLWMETHNEDVPAAGTWKAQGEIVEGISEMVINPDRTVTFMINGRQYQAELIPPEDGDIWYRIVNDDGNLKVQTSANSSISMYEGLSCAIAYTLDGPQLLFWDGFDNTSFGYKQMVLENEEAEIPAQ